MCVLVRKGKNRSAVCVYGASLEDDIKVAWLERGNLEDGEGAAEVHARRTPVGVSETGRTCCDQAIPRSGLAVPLSCQPRIPSRGTIAVSITPVPPMVRQRLSRAAPKQPCSAGINGLADTPATHPLWAPMLDPKMRRPGHLPGGNCWRRPLFHDVRGDRLETGHKRRDCVSGVSGTRFLHASVICLA